MFEGRALAMESSAPDNVPDGLGAVITYSGCKLGGKCHVHRFQVSEAVQELECSGYDHLLQIGEAGADLIKGFPWDPGFLNVWAKKPHDVTTYRFCVQQ